jgi:hypothetical protein
VRFTKTIKCNTRDVLAEVMPDGELVFHNYDMEGDLAAEAMGNEMSECHKLDMMFDEMPIEAMLGFPLTGKVWLAIFVTLIREKAFLYTDIMQMIDDLNTGGPLLPMLPLKMLDNLERSITKGMRKSPEETLEQSAELNKVLEIIRYNETFLEDTYEEGISSLIGATEAWIKAVRNLYTWCPGLNCQPLGDQNVFEIRKTIIDKIVETNWLICFFKAKHASPPERAFQEMFTEAMALDRERIEEMIQTMVAVANEIEE